MIMTIWMKIRVNRKTPDKFLSVRLRRERLTELTPKSQSNAKAPARRGQGRQRIMPLSAKLLIRRIILCRWPLVRQLKQTAKNIALISEITYSRNYPLPLASANGRKANGRKGNNENRLREKAL